MTLYDGDTFQHDGLTFTFRTERDDHMGAPWEIQLGYPTTEFMAMRHKES